MNKSPGGTFWAWKPPRFLRCSGILKSPCLKQKQTPHLERFGGMEMPKCPCSVSRGPKTGICLINSYCLLSSNQRVARSTHLKSELSAVNAASWFKVVETTCKNTYGLRERALGSFGGWAVCECVLPLELTVAEHRVVLIVVFPTRSKINVYNVLWRLARSMSCSWVSQTTWRWTWDFHPGILWAWVQNHDPWQPKTVTLAADLSVPLWQKRWSTVILDR